MKKIVLLALVTMQVTQLAYGVGVKAINNKTDALQAMGAATPSVLGTSNLLTSVGLPKSRGYQERDQYWHSLFVEMKKYISKTDPTLIPDFTNIEAMSLFAFNIMTGIYQHDIAPAIVEDKRSAGISDVDQMTQISLFDPKYLDFAEIKKKINLQAIDMVSLEAKISLLKEMALFQNGTSGYIKDIVLRLNQKLKTYSQTSWLKAKFTSKEKLMQLQKKKEALESLIILAEYVNGQIVRLIKDFEKLKNAYLQNKQIVWV